MRLAEFIYRDSELILQDWENFAATLLPAAAGLTQPALRGLAPQLLASITELLIAPQTESEPSESSCPASRMETALMTAAQRHADLR
jgi:hypothetical protein